MAESTLVRNITMRVRARFPRARVLKLSDRFLRGVPDLLILLPMKIREVDICYPLFVETKAKGGKTSAIQRAEHDRLRHANAEILVACTVECVLERLENLVAFQGR